MWENGGKDGKGNAAGFLSNLANTLPPMLQVMKDIGGVELPESLVKITTEADGPGTAQASPAAAVPSGGESTRCALK